MEKNLNGAHVIYKTSPSFFENELFVFTPICIIVTPFIKILYFTKILINLILLSLVLIFLLNLFSQFTFFKNYCKRLLRKNNFSYVNSIFSKKMLTGEPYWPFDFLDDIYLISYNFVLLLKNPFKLLSYFAVLLLVLFVKLAQFLISPIHIALILALLIKSYFFKTDLKFIYKIKHNINFFKLLYLLFFQLPNCFIFRYFYFFIKKINKYDSKKILWTVVAYNIFLRFFLGIPLSTINFTNSLVMRFEILRKEIPSDTIVNYSALYRLFLVSVRDTIVNDKRCCLNSCALLRIYYNDKNEISFNPMRKKIKTTIEATFNNFKIIDKGASPTDNKDDLLVSSIVENKNEAYIKNPLSVNVLHTHKSSNKSIKHPCILTEDSGDSMTPTIIKTHKPFLNQKGFILPDEGQTYSDVTKKNTCSYTIFNTIALKSNIINENETSYNPSQSELTYINVLTKLSRRDDLNAGVQFQINSKNERMVDIYNKEEGSFHEAALKSISTMPDVPDKLKILLEQESETIRNTRPGSNYEKDLQSLCTKNIFTSTSAKFFTAKYFNTFAPTYENIPEAVVSINQEMEFYKDYQGGDLEEMQLAAEKYIKTKRAEEGLGGGQNENDKHTHIYNDEEKI